MTAERWFLAFALAAAIALAGGITVTRRPPATRRAGAARGAVVIAAATLVGTLCAPDLTGRLVISVLAAVGVAVVGTLVDRGISPSWMSLAARVVAAVVVVAAGTRLDLTLVPVLDAALTILVILLVTRGMDGFRGPGGHALGLTLACTVGIFALAGFGSQDGLAGEAAALGGTALGLLACNPRPIPSFLGRAGTHTLGFLLAVAALDVEVTVGPPGRVTIPVLLVALPLFEAVSVAWVRARRQRSLAEERPDHLENGLAHAGWTPGSAALLVIGAQTALSVVAVFAGRGILPIVVATVIGLVALATIAWLGRRRDPEPALGFSHRFTLIGLGVVAIVVVAAIPAGLAAIEARQKMNDGRDAVERALDAARDGEVDAARQEFAAAAEDFGGVRDRLANPLVRAGALVPVVSTNLDAARALAQVGVDLADAGERLTADVDPELLEIHDGVVPLVEIARVAPNLAEGAELIDEAISRMDGIDDEYLVAPIRDAIDELTTELEAASREASNASDAVELAPAILGGEEPRRYFLAVQNNAELRATGGVILHWGILEVANGTIDLTEFEPVRLLNDSDGPERTLDAPAEYLRRYGRFQPENTWQNVNMSPDFPVVGQVIADLYPQSGGLPIDGVIAVDPFGLAALLELTGPVEVEGWPERLTDDNVTDIVLSEAYEVFTEQGREDFLGDAAETIFDVATESDLGKPTNVARALGAAARGGHIQVYFTRPEEEALALQVNAAGGARAETSDQLLVVSQNQGANKLDYFLRRSVDYSLTLTPDTGLDRVLVDGRVDVALENTAPSSGLSPTVIGPNLPDLDAGENLSFVSIYSPFELTDATIDGEPLSPESDRELGIHVYSKSVALPSGTTRNLQLGLEGIAPLDADGWYTLDLGRQPTVTADMTRVRIAVPSGWRIVDAEGLEVRDGRAGGRLELGEPTAVRVRIVAAPAGGLWGRLHRGA